MQTINTSNATTGRLGLVPFPFFAAAADTDTDTEAADTETDTDTETKVSATSLGYNARLRVSFPLSPAAAADTDTDTEAADTDTDTEAADTETKVSATSLGYRSRLRVPPTTPGYGNPATATCSSLTPPGFPWPPYRRSPSQPPLPLRRQTARDRRCGKTYPSAPEDQAPHPSA